MISSLMKLASVTLPLSLESRSKYSAGSEISPTWVMFGRCANLPNSTKRKKNINININHCDVIFNGFLKLQI